MNVRELMTGDHNTHRERVAVDSNAADETIAAIQEFGVEITSTQDIEELRVRPFNHFGADNVE